MKCKFDLDLEAGNIADIFALASLVQIDVNVGDLAANKPVRMVKDSSITKVNG
jgi:hypothetical protein